MMEKPRREEANQIVKQILDRARRQMMVRQTYEKRWQKEPGKGKEGKKRLVEEDKRIRQRTRRKESLGGQWKNMEN
jgi:hypothetical protein